MNRAQTARHKAASPPSWFGQFIRQNALRFSLFGISGAMTAVVYTGAFAVFRAVAQRHIVADVLAAYAVGVVANYIGGRLVFKAETPIRDHLPRYATVLAINAVVTWLVAIAAEHAGVNDFVIAWLPVLITSVPSYLLMHRWVFRPN